MGKPGPAIGSQGRGYRGACSVCGREVGCTSGYKARRHKSEDPNHWYEDVPGWKASKRAKKVCRGSFARIKANTFKRTRQRGATAGDVASPNAVDRKTRGGRP